MSLIKIRFGDDLGIIDADFRRSMEQLCRLANPILTTGRHRWQPQVDICECADEIMVCVELAGVKVEDLHVELDRTSVKVSGWRREPPLKESTRYRLAEIPYGYFERCLSLPAAVNGEEASANFGEGLLQLFLPKRKDAPRRIPVHTT